MVLVTYKRHPLSNYRKGHPRNSLKSKHNTLTPINPQPFEWHFPETQP